MKLSWQLAGTTVQVLVYRPVALSRLPTLPYLGTLPTRTAKYLQ